MSHPQLMPIRLTLAAICAAALLHAAPALAQQAAEVQLSYSNGASPECPAGRNQAAAVT